MSENRIWNHQLFICMKSTIRLNLSPFQSASPLENRDSIKFRTTKNSVRHVFMGIYALSTGGLDVEFRWRVAFQNACSTWRITSNTQVEVVNPELITKLLNAPDPFIYSVLIVNPTVTPPKTNMEPKDWWFVDVSPFPRGYFQVPCLFSGVYCKWPHWYFGQSLK